MTVTAAVLIAIAAVFTVYFLWENAFVLNIRHEDLGGNIRVLHISDLHKRRFGRDNSRICSAAEAEKPDMIIISGDIVTRNETDFTAVRNMLRRLCKTAPVYMIYGNHEQSLPPEMEKDFLRALGETDVVLLRNESVSISLKGRRIELFGLKESYGTYKKNGSYRGLERITPADMERYLGRRPESETFLIAHNPLFAEAYAEWGADKVFSGHVHGGAVRLFGVGMLSPERKLFPEYSKGVYTVGGTKLLVSAGLGKLRLFDPPEIVIYEI